MRQKNLSRREFLRVGALAAAGAALAGCAPQIVEKTVEVERTVEVEVERTVEVEVERTVEVERIVEVTATPARDVLSMPNAATGVPYEIKPQVNDGEPITLEYWEPNLFRSVYEEVWAQEYMNIYPNVTVEVVSMPWAEMFNKLLTSIPAGQGPAIWHMHMSRLTEHCEGQFMDPMPDYVASQVHLDSHWAGFAEDVFNCPGEGSRYFVPMGLQMPVLYINRTLWEEAGLTDSDVPKSWEQLKDVAKVLTKTDDTGRIIQAGFTMGHFDIFVLNGLYQQGRYGFTADRKHTQLDSPEGANVLELLYDLFVNLETRVVDPEFPGDGFQTGRAAMHWRESWFTGSMRRDFPDLDWFSALSPTFSGDLEPAIGRQHFAVETAVNALAPTEVKRVAWDFWHFLYSDDERLVRDCALFNGMLPAYDKLLNHPAVQADDFARVLVPGTDYGIVIGELPGVWSQTINQTVVDGLFVGGMSVDEALQAGQAEADAQLAQREYWNILERAYHYDDKMIQSQP